MLRIKFMGHSCTTVLRWMPLDTFNDKSILVQVTTWCHQPTSHYLLKCRPRFISPYVVSRPQWVAFLVLEQAYNSSASSSHNYEPKRLVADIHIFFVKNTKTTTYLSTYLWLAAFCESKSWVTWVNLIWNTYQVSNYQPTYNAPCICMSCK